MADDEKTSGKTVQDHPTTAAAVSAQECKGDPRASTSASVTIAVSAGPAEIAARRSRALASSAYLQPTSPSSGNDGTRSSSGSRKTGSRHSSGNSRKNSGSNLKGGRNGSIVPVDAFSAALLQCTGSNGSSRNSHSRLRSNSSGSSNGTITARKCVGCAAGRDNVVCSATTQIKRSNGDARDDTGVHSPLVHPSTVTGSVLRACPAAHSTAGGSALPFPRRLQQECHRKRKGQEPDHQCQQQGRQTQQNHFPQYTARQELQQVQHGEHGRQNLPSPGSMQAVHSHTINKEGQHSVGLVSQFRISVARQTGVFHSSVDTPGPSEQGSPVLVPPNPSKHCMEPAPQMHHEHRQEPQQLPALKHEQTLQLLEQTTQLQGQPEQEVRHSEQQGMRQDPSLQDQNLHLLRVRQEIQRVPHSEQRGHSFADSAATSFNIINTAGCSGSTGRVSDAAALYAATATAWRDGLIVSLPDPQENRMGLIPSIHAGEASAVSNRTPVPQQLSRHQVGIEMRNSATLQPSIQAVGPSQGSATGPSPSAAAMATTPRIRLAAASERHQPPPCTTVLPALPRCSVSTSGAYPEMPPVPVLNSEFDVTAAGIGEVCLCPSAAAILRAAASAAAAAAAAATDAASLAIHVDPPQELTGSGSPVVDTGVGGAAHHASLAPAATLVPTDLNASLAESPGSQSRDHPADSTVRSSTSTQQAAVESVLAQQLQAPPHEQCQHVDGCDPQHTLRGSTASDAERAYSPSTPPSTSRPVSGRCTGGNTHVCTKDSDVSSGPHMEKLQTLPATGLYQTSCFQDITNGACITAATAAVDVSASPLPRSPAPTAVVADPLSATSLAKLKDNSPGRTTPEDPPARILHALPHRGPGSAVCVSNETQGETPAASSCSAESASGTGPPREACKVECSTISTCRREVRAVTYQEPCVTNGATASATAATPRAAEALIVASPEESSATEGARASPVFGQDCQSQNLRVAHPVLRPLQLPESPRNSIGTSCRGITAVGTPVAEAGAANCVSPTATPGTPQNRQQQLLMHRTPAPQDRPRRPAAATAAGLLVRRGGPVTMWGLGGAIDPAVCPAAVENVPGVAGDIAAVTLSHDAGGNVSACGSTEPVTHENTVNIERGSVREKAGGDEKQPNDQEDTPKEVTSSEGSLHCEEKHQSDISPEGEETSSKRTSDLKPVATVASSAAGQHQAESKILTAEDMSSAPEERGNATMGEMHQGDLHIGAEVRQRPSPPQRQHQQDEQHRLVLKGQQSEQPQKPDNLEQELTKSSAPLQQQVFMECAQQDGGQSRREKQEMFQGEESSRLHYSEASATLVATVPSNLEGIVCSTPSVAHAGAAGTVGAASLSSALIPAAAEEEQQRDVQVVNSDIYRDKELVYFNGSNKLSITGNTSPKRRNKKKLVKQHSRSTDGTRSQSSNQFRKDSSDERSGSCSSRSGRRNGCCTESRRGDETRNTSHSALTYFPFVQEQGSLTGPVVRGDGEVMAPPPAGGITSITRTGNSATWQMQTHAANDAESALRGTNFHCQIQTETGTARESPFSPVLAKQQQDSDNPAGFGYQPWKYQTLYNPREQPYVSKDESDMEDNLPLSAAAMAAALGAGPSDTSGSAVTATEGWRERKPEQQFTSISQKEFLPPRFLEDGHHPMTPAPIAKHMDTQWVTTAPGWGPTHCGNTSQHDETTRGRAISRDLGDILPFPGELQATERLSLSHLQEQFGQLEQPCWNIGAKYRGRRNLVDTRVEDLHRSTLAMMRLNKRGSDTLDAAAAMPLMALPMAAPPSQGWDSRTLDSCSSIIGGASQPQTATCAAPGGGRQQLHSRLIPPIPVIPNAPFLSKEFLPPESYQQQGEQQQVYPSLQQHTFNNEAQVSHPTAPSSATGRALIQDDYPVFPASVSLPNASAQPAQLQPIQQQNLHLLRGAGKHTSPHLLQAAGGDTAAAFGVATGRSTYTYAARGEALLTDLSHEGTTLQQQHSQQSLEQQQHVQSVQQQLLLQHEQQPAAHSRQPVTPLPGSRVHSPCNAQMQQRLPSAGVSSVVVSNSWKHGSVPATPSPQQQESHNHNSTPCNAAPSSYRCTSSNTVHPPNPRLKRTGPGAAAATLAAAAGGVTVDISTSNEDNAGGNPANRAANLTTLPGAPQEESEAFCPFRRTVESRRARSNALGSSNNSAASAGSESGEESMADGAGDERCPSISSSRSTYGTPRKRFFGGTKRLFGGVKMHAAAANKQNRLLLNNCESAGSPPGGLLAPQHASQSQFSSRWQSHTPAHTPRGDPLLESHFPVGSTHQQPTTGVRQLQQLRPAFPGTQSQFAEAGHQQPLAPMSQQQPLLSHHQRLLSQQQPLSTLSQQQPLSPLSQQYDVHSRQHSTRTAQHLPYHLLSNPTRAYSTFTPQRHPHLRMAEQPHQFLGNHSSVSLLDRERIPSRYSHRGAKSALPLRGKSCSSTFLCETVPGSWRSLNIASLRRESQPGVGRSRNSSLPRLPCVAGRLLLAGGRAVGEVGQAAVDVGSTVVKELANVLQQSFKNILDIEEDNSCVKKREYDGAEHQCIRSNSLCIPLTGTRAGRCSHLLQHKQVTYGSDPALGAGQMNSCSTEEQLQHNLWMQRQVSRELLPQQQCGWHAEEQHQQGNNRGLQQQTGGLHPDPGFSHSAPGPFEEHQERGFIEKGLRTEGPPARAWGIVTEESLGPLWLPKLDCQSGSPSQLELHRGVEPNAAQQQVPLQPWKQKPSDQQQLMWTSKNQQAIVNEPQRVRHPKLKQPEQGMVTRSGDYAECHSIASRHSESEQSTEEETPPAAPIALPQWESRHTLQHPSGRLQRAHLQQLQENSQDRTSVDERSLRKDVPAFPDVLRWDDDTPQSSLSQSLTCSKQCTLTGAREPRNYVEQEEARERLVRLAASATGLQSSDISNNRLTEDKSGPAGHIFADGPVRWTDCEFGDQQGRSQPCLSSTTDASMIAFHQQGDNDTTSSNQISAANSLPSSCCEARLSASNENTMFWTGDPEYSTAFREPRKGTSTFGRPELLQQHEGKQSALCLSDDGSNCSTRNSCKEDDRALRELSVETLLPCLHSSKENAQREALHPANAARENLADGVPLQQQAEAYMHGDDPHEIATSRLHERAQQASYLSLHVQGINSPKQPFGPHLQPSHLPTGRPSQKKPENLPCMPYGAWVQDAVDTNAKLEARDRIVRRWKERATRNLAESLAAGSRRGR